MWLVHGYKMIEIIFTFNVLLSTTDVLPVDGGKMRPKSQTTLFVGGHRQRPPSIAIYDGYRLQQYTILSGARSP